MALPTLTFQIAFGSNPGDSSFTWTTVPGTKGLEYARGVPNEYGQVETGESTVDVGDAASDLDPNNAGGLVNRITNPSLEVNSSGWVLNGQWQRSTGWAKFGTYSLAVVNPTGANESDYSDAIEPGDFTFSVYVKNEMTDTCRVNLAYSTDGGASWHQDGSGLFDATLPPGFDGRYVQAVTFPAGTTHFRIRTINDGARTGTAYMDGFQLEPGATASDYCDGDQDNSRWSGTPHASSSYRGGRYWPNVKRMKAMRAFITVAGVDYPLFQHFIERLPRSVSVGSVWTERAIKGVDAFAWFALAGLKGRTFSGELSGARFANVLDAVGWPSSRRALDAGNSSLDPITFDENADTKALTHLLDVITSENGFGFMNGAGDAEFIERHSAIKNTTVVATFADGRSLETGDYPGALPYVDLKPESTDIVNDYSGKREAGSTVMTSTDATSVDDYGPRSQELTFLVDSDLEVQDALDWRLSQTKDPYERVDAITVMPGNDLARWVAVLGLEVGDRVLVVEWPPGFDAPVETEFLIRHLAGKLPVPLAGSTFTFQLTPASLDSWLVLDDATAGRLDFNKLAY